MVSKKSIAIIGGGSAALMLAASLKPNLFTVSIYEKNKAVGRKFLVAGDGGFNLTHGEPIDAFIEKYTPADFLKSSLLQFTNEDFRAWLLSIGIETYVGTSNKVYPIKGIKPIAVLKAILKVLDFNNVTIKTSNQWYGFTENGNLNFNNGETIVDADIVVFALGGASWSVTGSNGNWSIFMEQPNIKIVPFYPSNCEYLTNFKPAFATKWQGSPIKNITLTCNNVLKKGEIVITKNGLEGGAIYALSPQIRHALLIQNEATIYLDLKPSVSIAAIKSKLALKANKSISETLKLVLKLPPAAIALLKETISKTDFSNIETLAKSIKELPLVINDFGALDKAISTVGGIDLNEVDANFELKKLPNHFAIGEMLHWDAPTGGYLLQACASMGFGLGYYLNKKNEVLPKF